MPQDAFDLVRYDKEEEKEVEPTSNVLVIESEVEQSPGYVHDRFLGKKKENETVLTNKFNAQGNRKSTRQIDLKSTRKKELWRWFVLWTRHTDKTSMIPNLWV